MLRICAVLRAIDIRFTRVTLAEVRCGLRGPQTPAMQKAVMSHGGVHLHA